MVRPTEGHLRRFFAGARPRGRRVSVFRVFRVHLGYVALYLFDKRGRFLEVRIDDMGTRAALDEQRARSTFEQRLAELGPVEYGRIEVQPFEVERFGTTFGLVPRPPEEEDDEWAVEVQPGNYMAFFEPWDSGDYDT